MAAKAKWADKGGRSDYVRYLPRKGARLTADEAQRVGSSILRIQQANGGTCTPQELLAEATKKTSSIHDCFEWDDKKAAHSHRLFQASYYLRGIEIVVEHDGKQERQRANHAVVINDKRTYASFETVVSTPDLAEQVLAKAKAELVAWYHRYQKLERLNGIALVMNAIEKAGIVTINPGQRKPDELFEEIVKMHEAS